MLQQLEVIYCHLRRVPGSPDPENGIGSDSIGMGTWSAATTTAATGISGQNPK